MNKMVATGSLRYAFRVSKSLLHPLVSTVLDGAWVKITEEVLEKLLEEMQEAGWHTHSSSSSSTYIPFCLQLPCHANIHFSLSTGESKEVEGEAVKRKTKSNGVGQQSKKKKTQG
jgi:hypothetical protein